MNTNLPLGLPPLDATALEHSEQLKAVITQEITETGPIPFERFMQLALYAPGLGYYNCGSQKFGRMGDFITAPELSPLFSQCIAKQCAQVLEIMKGGNILEFGAGSGVMAADILTELDKHHCLPELYYIIEISAELKERQYQTLLAKAPLLINRIKWLNHLPTQPFKGIILANEVLDAMPVHRFYCDSNEIQEYYVSVLDNQFIWKKAPPSNKALTIQLKQLQTDYFGTNPYSSEINLYLPAWIKSIGDLLTQGLILLVDYGFPQHEYYHPDRREGTLMCHYQHRSHSDPLILPGLQDITSHVDFTAIAEAAQACDLTISGYTNQSSLLVGCGIADILQTSQYYSESERFNAHQHVKLLTLPSEMGELFKAMALTRKLDCPLLGFSFQNKLNRL